jgi:hypothetical protein
MLDYTNSAHLVQTHQTTSLIKAARQARKGRRRVGMRSLADVRIRPWSKSQLEIREIEKCLSAEGGYALMREAWWQVYAEDMRAANHIEIAWEGISGWFK